MSIFELNQELESVNGGVDRFNVQQLYPISGNVSGATVGAGQASGTSTFMFQDQTDWWSPSRSYFVLGLTFTERATVPVVGRPVTYADNFVMTLFTQVQALVNSQPLDNVNFPWLIDTALTYARAHDNFLKTWGSLTRVGEALSTRLLNVQTNGGYVEVVFRPPVSLFDVSALPPGAQFQFIFNWASNGLNAFESLDQALTWSTAATDYNVSITVNNFAFYKASCHPDPSIQLQAGGIIDLCATSATQYILNGGTQMRQNITLPATTNRVLLGFQDTNAQAVTTHQNNITGVGNGYTPATSFTNIFSTNTTAATNTFDVTTSLGSLWLSLPELGVQEPTPVYTFTGLADYMRAYSDFCNITQGTHDNMEGSIPFGYGVYAAQTPAPVSRVYIADTGANSSLIIGNPNNPQQYPNLSKGAGAPGAGTEYLYNQTSRWGWMGRIPGPIFAFPVVRPPGKAVSAGTLNMTTLGGSAAPVSLTATVIATYTMAIELQHVRDGIYNYRLVENI